MGKAKRHPTNSGIQIRRSLPISQVRRLGKAKRHPTNPGIQIRRSLPISQVRSS
ncbi:hypothetical protein AP9108_07450 [Arthrospira sp. PCC 9108]|nr:hypothetical protein AP9108_07450 [Arthrospira sp. PCC 9108]